MAGFLKWLFNRNKRIDNSRNAVFKPRFSAKKFGKIVVLTIALGLAALLYNHIYNLVKLDKRAEKDPIVRAYVTSMEYYVKILKSAQEGVNSNDITIVSNAISKLDKANDNVGNALYDNADISYLFNQGFLNAKQYAEAIKFRKKVQEVRDKLAERQYELL